MKNILDWLKLLLAALGIVVFISLAVIGGKSIVEDAFVKEYNPYLTQNEYQDIVKHQNMNLVFYKTGCPYCEGGKSAVVTAAESSPYPTFYIDIDTEEGQELIKEYHIEKAATIVQIRSGKPRKFVYAAKDKVGKIKADVKAIKEALNEQNRRG